MAEVRHLGFSQVPIAHNNFSEKTKLLFNLPTPTELCKCAVSQNLAVYAAYYEKDNVALFLEKTPSPYISIMFPDDSIVEATITPLAPMTVEILALFINQLKVISLGKI